ncbi:hypothetical protein D0X25_25080 [Salmonella enterica subsp. enterica serovar Kentucky]|uniref:Inner membrane protein n=14 Tax=Salmonella enterica TaxID=28901 RepID=A0A735ZLU1_SALTM|nr:hypothetical protein [Salmonella enterica]EAA4209377.1 hypothetical protein [Salmonella enterica subsp. enterica serovar Adelaide]EAB5743033.1 hypothetical protein [Salmonella enterica subsp. enterica serovar Monschaui]EAB6784316.1 hypothetical protein [Salmonella enterica subsp. enterica]EBG5868185.1 hypothetical protein [Salmonella enterica subsp. enterica serovar Essen]EBK1666606.1 hypothetical protein [Salmonella enterica subsp. enterica serovar Newport]EBK2211400.1 hypothetical protei
MKHFIRSIKMIWITMSISILCVSLLRLSQLDSNYDISELNSIMMYGMVIISFPTGIIFAIVLFLFLLSFGFIFTTIHSEYVLTVVIWGWFLFGGYVQWFCLVGKMIKNEEYYK